jgi:hypothetical protein
MAAPRQVIERNEQIVFQEKPLVLLLLLLGAVGHRDIFIRVIKWQCTFLRRWGGTCVRARVWLPVQASEHTQGPTGESWIGEQVGKREGQCRRSWLTFAGIYDTSENENECVRIILQIFLSKEELIAVAGAWALAFGKDNKDRETWKDKRACVCACLCREWRGLILSSIPDLA